MQISEANHLHAFVKFILTDPPLHKALKMEKCVEFAQRYNGPAYEENLCQVKLSRADARYAKALQEAASCSISSNCCCVCYVAGWRSGLSIPKIQTLQSVIVGAENRIMSLEAGQLTQDTKNRASIERLLTEQDQISQHQAVIADAKCVAGESNTGCLLAGRLLTISRR